MEVGIAVGVNARVWKRRYKTSSLEIAKTDLALRMRNQVAVEQLDKPDEKTIDDEPVLISDESRVSSKTRGKGVPLLGWLLLTNQRMVFADLDDKTSVSIPWSLPRITHDEDGFVTLAWRDGKSARAVTFGLMPKSKLHTVLRTRLAADAAPLQQKRPNRISRWIRRPSD